jgi:hypothetical protein
MAEEPPQEGQQQETAESPFNTPEPSQTEPDWKAESRKHEKRSKDSFAEVQRLSAELDSIKEASQSEQEKAITKARKEERAQAFEEYETDRRAGRLEVAVAARARDIADKALDDVVLNLQRSSGDLFTAEGKIDDRAFGDALGELLERKPHLRAGTAPVPSDVDQGKGAGPAGDDMNAWLRTRK